MKRLLLIMFLFLIGLLGQAEISAVDSLKSLIASSKEDSNKVLAMLELSNELEKTNLNEAIENNKKALELSRKIKYLAGEARTLKAIGIEHYFLGEFADALIIWQQAKLAYELNGDSSGVANMLSNMGAIYHDQSNYDEAIDLYIQSLKIAERIDDQKRIATVLQNIGAVHVEKNEDSLAIKAFERALPLFEALDYSEGIGLSYFNLGQVYDSREDYTNAEICLKKSLVFLANTHYFTSALTFLGKAKLRTSGLEEGMFYLDSSYRLAEQIEDEFECARILGEKAIVYEELGNYEKAISHYEGAKNIFLADGHFNKALRSSAKGLVRIFTETKDYQKAFENQLILQQINDTLYNVQSDKQVHRLLFKHEIDKKEGEIALLVKDKEIQSIELKKQKDIRNAFIFGFVIVLLFASIFLFQRNQIKKGKALSDELLLNILPHEIASELKTKGSADARNIDLATVLFTDFKGFTALAEKLSAKELVADINKAFTEFDKIIEKHGIEKIKTIGDAYMAAGGLPTPNKSHTVDVLKAALEIRDFIDEMKSEKRKLNLPYFEIRLGIHTGPVVAGIVGVKKFSYDIWGDTVNIASRMESHGAVGKVNVSQATYELLKDNPQFTFESRGKIETKGKGEIHMYFVSLN